MGFPDGFRRTRSTPLGMDLRSIFGRIAGHGQGITASKMPQRSITGTGSVCMDARPSALDPVPAELRLPLGSTAEIVRRWTFFP